MSNLMRIIIITLILETFPDEHVLAEILRDKPKGRRCQLLVRWADESLGVTWEPQRKFVDVEAYHHYMRQRVFLAQEIDSPSVSEALDSNNRDDWLQAMDAKIESIKSHGTYEAVDRPFNKKVISTKWILRVKRDSDNNVARYKARSVARGFSQRSAI
jgi:Reverse transcriptase (RNA-dependent DNA polymerase)